ncbi:MAG: hypothetical protein JNL73_00715 [Anaerolineales bacterium]|nr:hypothetical protein [Anaerolineales bacterium]
MPRILFLFLDGVGLGADDPARNPLAAADLPTLSALLAGARPLAATLRTETASALFIPTDAGLGVDGLPQSATGQAALLTGRNIPAEIGGHWGPKPNAAVAQVLRAGSIFHELRSAGRRAALLSGYPQRYFDAIASGRRSYSAIPLAATAAGLDLAGEDDIRAGRALGADFTNAFWRSELGSDVPVYTPREAGQRLAAAAAEYDFALFEHWVTDYVGHRGALSDGIALVEQIDQVLAGVLDRWDLARDLVIITSDHGNLEDLGHRHHTLNRVPTFLIGAGRAAFDDLHDLTGLVPGIRRVLLQTV